MIPISGFQGITPDSPLGIQCNRFRRHFHCFFLSLKNYCHLDSMCERTLLAGNKWWMGRKGSNKHTFHPHLIVLFYSEHPSSISSLLNIKNWLTKYKSISTVEITNSKSSPLYKNNVRTINIKWSYATIEKITLEECKKSYNDVFNNGWDFTSRLEYPILQPVHWYHFGRIALGRDESCRWR